MPADQQGVVDRRGRKWRARWYDENNSRRSRSGFGTKSEALAWVREKAREVEAIRNGDVAAIRRQSMPTLAELVDEYVEQHNAEANTLRTLKARLWYATHGPELDGVGGFADLRLDRLTAQEIGAWRKRLPAGSAWHVHKALRQVLHYAVRAELVGKNVAAAVPNPEPKRKEVPAFADLDELEKVADELAPERKPLPIFAALTGLRPSEWIALERRDIDRAAGVVHVRRVYTDGHVKAYGKTAGSQRVVPLPARTLQALAEVPPRLDTPLLFPGDRGGHLNLNEWRNDEWTPAVRAAGLAHRSPYSIRHTYATFSIAAGVNLFELARMMGTSLEQISKTYGHLLPDVLDRTRTALDVFLAASSVDGERVGESRLGH
jgi:integrase